MMAITKNTCSLNFFNTDDHARQTNDISSIQTLSPTLSLPKQMKITLKTCSYLVSANGVPAGVA